MRHRRATDPVQPTALCFNVYFVGGWCDVGWVGRRISQRILLQVHGYMALDPPLLPPSIKYIRARGGQCIVIAQTAYLWY